MTTATKPIRLGVIKAGEESEAEYRSCGAWSQSAIRDYMQNPEYFRLVHIVKEGEREETTNMRMGTALHCALLEESEYDKRFIIQPEGMRKGTKAHDAWLENTGGRTVLTYGEDRTVRRMRQSVLENKDASRLLNHPGENEMTLRYRHSRWGLLIQGKLDAYRENVMMPNYETPQNAILDLKSTDNIDHWRKEFHYSGYYIQAWWYQQLALAVLMLDQPPRFVFIVVERKCPWRVALFEPIEAYETQAKREVEEAVDGLNRSLSTGMWNRDVPGIQYLHPKKLDWE